MESVLMFAMAFQALVATLHMRAAARQFALPRDRRDRDGMVASAATAGALLLGVLATYLALDALH